MLINELLHIKYPIIQGAMAFISDGKFAACCSNAGGLGIVAAGELELEQIRKEIRICKSLTDKPFAVNIFMLRDDVEAVVDLVIEEEVKIVTTGAQSPLKFIKKLKDNNIMVFPVTSSVVLAKRMEKAGVDGIICEGMEAGGHVGNDTTMSLIVQMTKELDIPVIAAGGIATGKQLAAALAMGASGIQIGTILLASEECEIHQNFKDLLLKAKDNDTFVLGNSFDAVRVYKNRIAKEYKNRPDLDLTDISRLALAIQNGDLEEGIFTFGQIAGIIDEIKPVEEIFKDIVKEAVEIKEELNQKLSKLAI